MLLGANLVWRETLDLLYQGRFFCMTAIKFFA